MPIYEFRCEYDQCLKYNQSFESLVTPNAPVLCDECLNPANKLVSAPPGRVSGGTPRFHSNSKRY